MTGFRDVASREGDRMITCAEAAARVRAMVHARGGVVAAADAADVTPQEVSYAQTMQRPPAARLARFLGLRRVVAYVIEDEHESGAPRRGR